MIICCRWALRLNSATRKAGNKAWPRYSGTASRGCVSLPTSLPSKLGMMTALSVACANHTNDRTYHGHEAHEGRHGIKGGRKKPHRGRRGGVNQRSSVGVAHDVVGQGRAVSCMKTHLVEDLRVAEVDDGLGHGGAGRVVVRGVPEGVDGLEAQHLHHHRSGGRERQGRSKGRRS